MYYKAVPQTCVDLFRNDSIIVENDNMIGEASAAMKSNVEPSVVWSNRT
jgi:hypothetical protein